MGLLVVGLSPPMDLLVTQTGGPGFSVVGFSPRPIGGLFSPMACLFVSLQEFDRCNFAEIGDVDTSSRHIC